MSDVQGAGPAQDNGTSANVIYILYLAAFLAGGVTTLIGVIMAYVYRGTAPAWVQTHYQLQIRTFWIVILGLVVGGALSFIIVGIPMLIAVLIWYIVRCVKGMMHVGRREAYPNPETWLW